MILQAESFMMPDLNHASVENSQSLDDFMALLPMAKNNI